MLECVMVYDIRICAMSVILEYVVACDIRMCDGV